jgi:hypothetical protein
MYSAPLLYKISGHYRYQYTPRPTARQYFGHMNWRREHAVNHHGRLEIGYGKVVARIVVGVAHDIPAAYDLELELVRGLLPPPECICLADRTGDSSSRGSTAPTPSPTVIIGKQRGWVSLQGANAKGKQEPGMQCASWGGGDPWCFVGDGCTMPGTAVLQDSSSNLRRKWRRCKPIASPRKRAHVSATNARAEAVAHAFDAVRVLEQASETLLASASFDASSEVERQRNGSDRLPAKQRNARLVSAKYSLHFRRTLARMKEEEELGYGFKEGGVDMFAHSRAEGSIGMCSGCIGAHTLQCILYSYTLHCILYTHILYTAYSTHILYTHTLHCILYSYTLHSYSTLHTLLIYSTLILYSLHLACWQLAAGSHGYYSAF